MKKGQSLVETALIVPILCIMLIGVFEVGWALRSYLILLNASREGARFAVRDVYVDFDSSSPDWERVKNQTINSIAGTMPVDFNETGTLVVSYLEVNAGEFPDSGNCTDTYTMTIRSPLTEFGLVGVFGEPKVSKFDYAELGEKIALENRAANCELIARGGIPSVDGLVIVEIFYDHPQLIKFPFLSNKLTDPIRLHAYTIMRNIKAVRSSGKED